MKVGLFKSDIDYYHRASPCRPTRRLITAIIDFFILVAVSLILYIGTYNITINIDGYKELETKVAYEVEYYENYIEETHLVEFYEDANGEKQRAETEEVATKILIRSLLFSYNHDKNNDFSSSYDVHEKLKQYEETNLQNDNILYFLSEYLPSRNANNEILDLKGKTPVEFYKYCLEKSGGESYFNEYFTVDPDTGISFVKPYVANKIFGFVYNNVSSSTASTYYDNIVSIYMHILTDLETVMLENPTYQAEHYQPYEQALIAQAGYIIVSLVINLVVAYLLTIVLPQILFRDGRTFARKIFNVGVISRGGGQVRWFQILGRCLFGFCGSFISLYLIPILPMFNFQYVTFNVPFFKEGDFYLSLGIFVFAFGIATVVNALPVPILKKKYSLVDLATQSRLVDGRHLDEIDYEEPREEGK